MQQFYRNGLNKLLQRLLSMPRILKLTVVMLNDAGICVLATWFAFVLRLGSFEINVGGFFASAVISSVLLISIFSLMGQYKILFRFSGAESLKSVFLSITIYGTLFSLLTLALGFPGVPRTIGLIQPLVLFVLIAFSRLFATWLLKERWHFSYSKGSRLRVLIYGAGITGRNLFQSLSKDESVVLIGFCDDDPSLMGHKINGGYVYHADLVNQIISDAGITHVLLAIPSAPRATRRKIIERLSACGVAVRTVPAMHDILSGNLTMTDILELDINDLLGRQVVDPVNEILQVSVVAKSVLVSGGGGSIGSELCRQILMLNPSQLLVLDASEFALYRVIEELSSIKLNTSSEITTEIIPLLASVQDKSRIELIFDTWKPQKVFHAAAYKHVPLVEHNVSAGIENNILGTFVVAEAARRSRAESFVLVSTDKAVRPTNVMGASKRVAEMIVQAINAKEGCKTRFSVVRFGNVLESSGSVIPKFREQIKEGGPITVTHEEVTRFFMTIPEAAQLVIQASEIGVGGEVFVLDMGEPVRIIDLAKKMIALSGLKMKSSSNPEGDIEIKIVGLRPGEKLFEELLIGNNPWSTPHPKILQAREAFLNWEDLMPQLDKLMLAAESNDMFSVQTILTNLVEGYVASEEVVDLAFKAAQ